MLAMYKAVTPRLHGELDALMQDWEEWLPAVGRWTPATGEAPLPRPVSPAHSRVLSTVEAWYEFVQDRTRDVVVKMFADAGGEVEEMIHVRADGQLVEHARITFPKPASAPAPDRREGGLWARLRGWFG